MTARLDRDISVEPPTAKHRAAEIHPAYPITVRLTTVEGDEAGTDADVAVADVGAAGGGAGEPCHREPGRSQADRTGQRRGGE